VNNFEKYLVFAFVFFFLHIQNNYLQKKNKQTNNKQTQTNTNKQKKKNNLDFLMAIYDRIAAERLSLQEQEEVELMNQHGKTKY